jgi:hypothetical protein
MKIQLSLLSLFLVSGCTSLAGVSAGHVGCLQDDIKISNEQTDWSTKTWMATCEGRNYICSYAITGSSGHGGTTGQVNCSPMGNNRTKADNIEQSPEIRPTTVKETVSIPQQAPTPTIQPIPVVKPVIENPTPTNQSYQKPKSKPINDLKDCRYLETDFAIAECVRGN